MKVDELINKASLIVDNVNKDLDSLISKSVNTDISIPDYDDIKSRKIFYTKYSNIITLNSDIARQLLLANKLILSLKDIVNEIANTTTIQYSLVAKYRDTLNNQVSKLNEKVEIINEFKRSLEHTLKFYNSLQYILSSYRFEE